MPPIRSPLASGPGASSRGAAAMVVAATLAVAGAGAPATLQGEQYDLAAGRIDKAMGPIRAALRPGDRVALLDGSEDLASLYATQYALAPALVVAIPPGACQAPADLRRCLPAASHLLVPGSSSDQVAALAARFDLSPVVACPAATLLARRQR